MREAKTVTKLTELAFLFIPLSFTCSLFSMSIRELNDGVPVWTFVVTALGLAILSYAMRLILTSDVLAKSVRRAQETVWQSSGVRHGDDVPVTTIVWLITVEIWTRSFLARFMAYALVTGLLAIPLGLMWRTTKLDIGFNTTITLCLVLSGIAMAFFISTFGGGDPQGAWRVIRKKADTNETV
jgi:hypothetical protein